MTGPSPSPAPELWCRGCRRAGVRRLDHAERAWLADLRARHLRRVASALALFPAIVAAMGAVLVGAGTPAGPLVTALAGVVLVVALLLVLPVCILLVRDHLGEFRRAGRDLAGGDAWWFEPPAWPDAPDGAERAAFGLLPHLRRVVDLGTTTLLAAREDVIETEPQSEPGWYAPLSLEVAGPGPDPGLRQRTLAPRERAELARASARLRWPTPHTWLTLAVMTAALSLILQQPASGRYGTAWLVLKVAGWIYLGTRVARRYLRGVRLAGSMRRDLEAGLVVHAPGARGPGEEFLPFSRLMWRSGGAPAGWRDRRHAARRLAASL